MSLWRCEGCGILREGEQAKPGVVRLAPCEVCEDYGKATKRIPEGLPYRTRWACVGRDAQ